MSKKPENRSARLLVQILGAILTIAVPLAAACGGKIENQNGGGGLIANDSGSPSSSASTSPTVSASSDPGKPSVSCDASGLSTSSGAGCSVSFQKKIFASYLAPEGAWRCTDSNCHGPSSMGDAPNPPTIDGQDAHKAYVTLAQYQLSGRPYVDACSNNPNDSAILDNLGGSLQPQMPMPGAGVNPPHATPEQIADVKTWLACGAPFN